MSQKKPDSKNKKCYVDEFHKKGGVVTKCPDGYAEGSHSQNTVRTSLRTQLSLGGFSWNRVKIR